MATTASAPGPTDPTFRSYTEAQARSYSAARASYPDELMRIICEHHASTGGKFTQLLDVGCGPGNGISNLAPFFAHATGVDPGVAMVQSARSMPSRTGTSDEAVRFEVCASEDIDTIPDLAAGSVDLITAATAAHWFSMPVFWQKACQMLRPGGTVAIWTAASYHCHPHTTPNAARVQEILYELERDVLAPYELPPNRLSRDRYVDLGLPWTVSPPEPGFSQEDFVRMEWNRDGEVQPGETFFRGRERVTLDEFARGCATASMVTRWRQANPTLAGTEHDCVNVAVRKLKEAMGGRDWLEGGSALVLLMFKKNKTEGLSS